MEKFKFKNNTVSIVAYHYTRELSFSKYRNFNFLKFSEFKKQLSFFKKNFQIISADEMINFLNIKEKLKKPLLMLSFDDGYIDHYKYVMPTLIENKIKGCFYPPINIFKGKLLNVNKIHFILNFFKNRRKLLELIEKYLLKNFNYKIDKKKIKKLLLKNKTNNQIPEYDDEITLIIKKLLQIILPEEIREKTCDYLLFDYLKMREKDLCKDIYMNIKQLRQLASEGMHIGSHGVEHQYWKLYDLNYQKKEIIQSKSFFKRNKIATKNFSVCYPWGSYNSDTKRLMESLNLSFGLTSNSGNFNLSSKINKFFLPRFDANEFKNI